MKEICSEKDKDCVLLVTNQDEISRVISEILSNEKELTILRAHSVIEALSLMTFSIPSIIIADINLPGLSGFDLLHSIRKSIKTKLIPFIIISPEENKRERIAALKAGADDLMVFPFAAEEFAEVVRSKLNKFKEFYLLTITDELTRLFNRREFIKKINGIVSTEPENTLSLAILDIDHFKMVNDTYGHQTGDKVLMRLAEILKEKTSSVFFPARFGGEEFVILFTGAKVEEASEVMKALLKNFSDEIFENEDKRFHVTFSAGVAQYPLMATNASELLTRADQALYAAKEAGRNRIIPFSPIMARNDKFWEYLQLKKGLFIDERNFESVTHLPYLPQMLEIVSNLDFEVKSIGVLIIKLHPILSIEEYLCSNNYQFDIENIKIIITKSCELVFPSDTYIGLSSLFEYEFCIFFPSMVNFTFNLDKFNTICSEISETITESLAHYNYDISFSSDVLSLDKANPRNMYSDIITIGEGKKLISGKEEILKGIHTQLSQLTYESDITSLIQLKYFYKTGSCEPVYQYLSLLTPFNRSNIMWAVLNNSITDSDNYHLFLELVRDHLGAEITHPILIPYITSIPFSEFAEITHNILSDFSCVICINEYSFESIAKEFTTVSAKSYDNITFAIDNCYISNQILNYLSLYDFSMLLFSENITRKLYMHKNRIKVISGLKIFLEQVGIKAVAQNILLDEEYQIIRDLKISFASGDFLENTCIEKSLSKK